MKLLICKNCNDIFNLSSKREKSCYCGKTKGYYLADGLNAEYSGEHAIPLGFSNPSLINAIRNQPDEGWGERFEAFVIPKKCKTMENV